MLPPNKTPSARTIRRSVWQPCVEQLEDRNLLSVLEFTAPSGNGLDDMVLRRDGNRLELISNGEVVDRQSFGGLTAVVITGAAGEDDRLTIDFDTGDFFSVQDGITFVNEAGVGGIDALTVIGTSAANMIALTPSSLTVDGGDIFFSNVEELRVNSLAGADILNLADLSATTITTLDGGTDTDTDIFSATLAGNFTGNLTVMNFQEARMSVTGDFAGQWTVASPGTIDDLMIGGSLTGSGVVTAQNITRLVVLGNVAGTIIADHGTINEIRVEGTIGPTGMVMVENIGMFTIVQDLYGNVAVHGSGTIDLLDVGGSVGTTGMVMAEDITNIRVMRNLDGTLRVSSPLPGSGNLGTITIDGNFTGFIFVEEKLTKLSVKGSSTGTVEAGEIEIISAEGATAGSPVLQVTESGVTRRLIATRVDNGLPTPATVKFGYFYDSTGASDPRITVRVTNGNPATSADDVRFDLSLTTSSATEFDLARLFSVGTSGIRNVLVEGDILTTISPAALTFFGLPAGTLAGVRLPTDHLGAVAVQDNVVAGNIQASSLQAVAFGSLTSGGTTIPGEAANHVDAADLLASGTTTVRANDTFLVALGEAQKVALFLDTGPGVFDVKNVVFADQTVDNLSVTAEVAVANGTIRTVKLTGTGGSIRTVLPITLSITSSGALGDLSLLSSNGVPDVTAPSIFGNIDTNGPIYGTIQTTTGDLGSALRNATGTIIGATTINTSQGIPGRIISRGNLVSRISSQKEFTGLIAAQGDMGVAYVRSGQLVRFGGILSNGQLSGRIVTLGNILGDIDAKNGVAGRIVAKGRAIVGLAPSRIGILGNINVSGNLEVGGAIVSGGVIGDVAGGTVFDVGVIKGIVAAKGDINFRRASDTRFENATGANAAAIDAIFTRMEGMAHGFDLSGTDLAGLSLILTDLNALRVVSGTLTGPVA